MLSTGRPDWDAAAAELARADTVAFGGVGFAGQLQPVTLAHRALHAAGLAVRPTVEELLVHATPAGRVYAATLLEALDPAAGQAAWRYLAGQPGQFTEFSGCVMVPRALAEYAAARCFPADHTTAVRGPLPPVPGRAPSAATPPAPSTPAPSAPLPWPPAGPAPAPPAVQPPWPPSPAGGPWAGSPPQPGRWAEPAGPTAPRPGRVFRTVWLTTDPPRASFRPRRHVGTLQVGPDGVSFRSEQLALDIPRDRLIGRSLGLAGTDIVNNWVRLDHLDPHGGLRSVFLCDGRFIGWGGVLGGTRKIAAAIAAATL